MQIVKKKKKKSVKSPTFNILHNLEVALLADVLLE